MAVPPSVLRPPVVPDPAVAHAATVKELERCLDASLLGRRAPPGEQVVLTLPIGDHGDDVLNEIEARYVKAGWESAAVKDGKLTLTPVGYVAPTPEPPAAT